MTLLDKNDKIYVAGHKGMVGNAIVKNLQKNGFYNLLLVNKEQLTFSSNIFFAKLKCWFAKISVGAINATWKPL